MSEQGKPLEYGQVPVGTRRRRVLRWIVVAALLIAAGVVVRYRGPIWERVKYVRAWSAVANHDLAEGEVVYSADISDVRRLKNDPRYTFIAQSDGGYVLRNAPPELATIFGTLAPARAPAFIGERRTPDGKRVLVAAQVSNTWVTLGASVTGGPWEFGQRRLPGGAATPGRLIERMGQNKLRIFAGRADPKDPSRFSFEFDNLGRRGVITGRVGADGSVTFEVTPPKEGWMPLSP
jgi:hypothetical protein